MNDEGPRRQGAPGQSEDLFMTGVKTWMVRCGKNWCHCASGDFLHGPYYYRFYRESGRQHKEYVPKDQVEQVRAAIHLWKAFHPPISSIEASLHKINQLYKTLTQE